jgi:hypothetical protein
MSLNKDFTPTPRSESPKQKRADGSPIKRGYDARNRAVANDRGATVNTFLDGTRGHGKHAGDTSASHNQSESHTKEISEKSWVPANDETGATIPRRTDAADNSVRQFDWGNGHDPVHSDHLQVTQPVSGGAQEAEHHEKSWGGKFEHVDPPAKHPGFKSVQNSIAKKQGISKERAGAILGSATRHASAAAKKANPHLKRVKGH